MFPFHSTRHCAAEAGKYKTVALLVLVFLVCVLVLEGGESHQFGLFSSPFHAQCANASGTSAARAPRKAYFDLGANNGDSVTSFLGLSPKIEEDRGLYQRGAGGGWDVWIFEANPQFDEALLRVERKIRESGKHAAVHRFNSTAVWKADGNITLYLDTVQKVCDYCGSSVVPEHRTVRRSRQSNGDSHVHVPARDISKIIIDNYGPLDTVIVKMDIEGAEAEVLRQMVTTGTIGIVDELYVEFHTLQIPALSEHIAALQWLLNDKLRNWAR